MGTHDIISLTPLFIHNGPGMVPYLTLEWSGYSTVPQPQHHHHRNPSSHHDYSHRPPRQHPQTYYQHYNSKGASSTSTSSNGSARQPSQQQQKGGGANSYNKGGRNRNSNNGGPPLRHSRSAVNLSQTDGSFQGPSGGPGVQASNGPDFSCTSAPVSPRDMNRRRFHQRRPSIAGLETLPALLDSSEDAPDLERFLKASTPCVRLPGGAAAELRLSDVWRFYERSSVFGLECAALGGPRGPSNCYFVPYLSAVHIFNPVEVEEGVPTDEEIYSFPQGLDSWPTGMRRGFSWAAAEHVADRLPLHTRVTELATRDGSLLEEHPLWSSKLVDLHPYSWFAVAWYPLYRIPDAPLTARFLTFHSLAPLWEAATAAEREVREAAEAAAATEISSAGAGAGAGSGNGSAASYKLMLETRGPGGNDGPGSATGGLGSTGGGPGTPTGVAPAYPGSPFSSEATRTGPCSAITAVTATTSGASGGSRSHSVISAPATGSDSVSVGPSYGSLSPSPAASDAGDDRPGAMAGISTGSGQGTLAAPAVGLCWHTAGSAAGENWTDTLVTVDVPEDPFGRGLRRGDVLPGPSNASVAGVWPRAAVIRKDYPLAKGGPLSWEIQLEELEEGARRLALQQGLLKIRPGGITGPEEDGQEEEPASRCPDYDFFSSRRR